jgi:hypothetical protein
MHVQLLGFETADVLLLSGGHIMMAGGVSTRARHCLIQADIPVNDSQMIQNGRISPGSYRLPFVMELPEFLSSFGSVVQESDCGIDYRIKATLKRSGIIHKYDCYLKINVKAHPLEKVGVKPFEDEPESLKVRSCFLNRGTMTIGAHLADAVLQKGQRTKLSISCRNNSNVRVKMVEAKLVQITRWYARGCVNERQTIFQAMSFGTQGLNRKVKMLQPGASEQIQILEELRRGTNSHVVKMPPLVLNTYQGKVISVEHELRIKSLPVSAPVTPKLPFLCVRAKQDFSAPHADEGLVGAYGIVCGSSKSYL